MATPADNIQTSINNLAANLAAITASPQPNYNIGGVSMTLNEYKSSIIKDMADLTELLVVLSGPYQLISVGVS